MEIKDLFRKVIENNDAEKILESLNMHHIVDKGEYITCGQPDGDNPASVVVFKDNLWVEAYTRDISDQYGYTNIISLVSFIRKTYISQSIKWICDICNYNYYEESKNKTEMIKFLDYIYSENTDSKADEDEVLFLKPIEEYILKYYGSFTNSLFLKDNIDLQTQRDFELGYDLETHSITIPIRDELSTLVGVKARLFKELWELEDWESKYFYLVPCAKSKILYGLHKTMPYIIRDKSLYVVESEKSVMKLWSYGIRNVVSIGGHKLSKTQIKKIVQLGVRDINICFDQDVARLDDGKVDLGWYKKIANNFLQCHNIYGLIDYEGGILLEKESPVDDLKKFESLCKHKIILLSEGCI